MTLHEAYLKAKNEGEKSGRPRLNSCSDYGEFWGFMFLPPIGEEVGDGIADITINKKTGKISYFNPIMDLDVAEKSITISIDQFAEYSVAI
jgi:hypothetical protein